MLVNNGSAFHGWHRFVLSFSPALVKHYIDCFGLKKYSVLLDPFCGMGTTLVEAKMNGITAIGLDANPFACFVSSTKVDWDVNPDELCKIANEIASESEILYKNKDESFFNNLKYKLEISDDLILNKSISYAPFCKVLVLADIIKRFEKSKFYNKLLLALANITIYIASNVKFCPEPSVKEIKADAPVIKAWLMKIYEMARDLRSVDPRAYPDAKVHLGDARRADALLPPQSIDAVITSPPYPNEKDYTRITRLELVLLGFVKNDGDIRKIKESLICSSTRNVKKEDNNDEQFADKIEIVEKIVDEIEYRRLALGKDSGFEKLYGTVTRRYFGGMARHLAALRSTLRPGAQLAYVVGDQCSYLRVTIQTGRLLAEIARGLGYDLVRIDPYRTRFASKTRAELREEVVVLRWNG